MTKRNNEKRVAGRLLTEERIGRFQGPSARLHDQAQKGRRAAALEKSCVVK